MAVLAAIAVVGAVAGAAGGIASTASQKDAARRGKASARRAAATRESQERESAQFDRIQARRRAARVSGRIRALAGAQGSDVTGNLEDIAITNAFESSLNSLTIDRNEENAMENVESRFGAQSLQLGQTDSALTSAFLGAVQGAQTGASIGGIVDEAGEDE